MRIAVALAVVLVGCYTPKPRAGIQCSDDTRACPDGLACRPSTNTCEVAGADADGAQGVDAARGDDAPADAVVIADASADAPPPPVATLEQQIEGATNAGSSLTVTLPQLPLANDVLVMVGGNPSGGLTSVTGGGVVTWTLAARSTVNNNIEIWYGTSDGSAADVAIARTGANSASSMWVGEFAHLAPTATLDRAIALDGTTSPAGAGAIMTAQAHDLILFAVADGIGNTFGAPTPGNWVGTDPVTGSFSTTQQVWYRNVGGPATFSPTVTETAHYWDAGLVGLVRQ